MHEPESTTVAPGCVAAIIPAAGGGMRFGSPNNKLFAELAGQPIWYHSAKQLRDRNEIGRIVMPIADADRIHFDNEYAGLIRELRIELVAGGAERTDSVRAGLSALSGDNSVICVAVHDAARPLISESDVEAVIRCALAKGAAILASPVSGTIKRRLDGDRGTETVDRRELWTALTPQVFHVGLLQRAYERHNGRPATDDAQIVERMGHPVAIVSGSSTNLKITYPEDLHLAEAILARQSHHG